MIELVFETHSLTEDNEAGIATGWLPGRLSERGRELAAELGRRRRDDGIAAVFASDLVRAAETARIAFEGSAIPVFLDWRLRECNYGELNGHPAAEVHAVRGSHLQIAYPGGESWTHAVSRIAGILPDLGRGWDGRRVLVIGHVATRLGFETRLNHRPLEEALTAPFAWQPGWEYRLP